MAESTQLRDQSFPRTLAPHQTLPRRRVWNRIKTILLRSIFWPYERGSWQYDIICALILAFIFLTPASWFHDRPTLGLTSLRHTQGIVEVGRAGDGWHYLVDARLVASMAPLKPGQAVRKILQRRFHKSIELKSVEVLRNGDDVILGYSVVLTR